MLDDRRVNKTVILIVGFIIILILQYFYSPWEYINPSYYEEKSTINLETEYIKIIIPVISTFYETIDVAKNYITLGYNNNGMEMYFVFCLSIWICIGVNFMIKAYENEVEDENNNRLRTYIESLCLQNIIMYVVNIFLYFIRNKIGILNEEYIMVIQYISIILIVITFWAGMCYFLYVTGWSLAIFIVPMLLSALVEMIPFIGNFLSSLVLFIGSAGISFYFGKSVSTYLFEKIFTLFTNGFRKTLKISIPIGLIFFGIYYLEHLA